MTPAPRPPVGSLPTRPLDDATPARRPCPPGNRASSRRAGSSPGPGSPSPWTRGCRGPRPGAGPGAPSRRRGWRRSALSPGTSGCSSLSTASASANRPSRARTSARRGSSPVGGLRPCSMARARALSTTARACGSSDRRTWTCARSRAPSDSAAASAIASRAWDSAAARSPRARATLARSWCARPGSSARAAWALASASASWPISSSARPSGRATEAGETGGEPHGLLVRGRGLLESAQTCERPGQIPLDLEGAQVLREQASERREGFCVLPLSGEPGRVLQLLVHLDPVSRVRQHLFVARRDRPREVAERLQPLGYLRVHAARTREVRGVALRAAFFIDRATPASARTVSACLPGVANDFVELRLRPVDVVMPGAHERAQRAPPEMDPRVVRLAVDLPGASLSPRASIEKRRSPSRLAPELQEGRDRRHDVGQPDGLPQPRSGVARARKLQQERHVEDLAIEQDPVLLLAVVPEPLPMVGDQEDDRAVVDAVALELPEELPDDAVARRDLAVVGRSVAAPERLGRLVGEVRLVDVQEEKERLRLHALDPGQGTTSGLAAGALQQAHVPRPLHVAAHGVVEEIQESLTPVAPRST